jgi:hypothetical protein
MRSIHVSLIRHPPRPEQRHSDQRYRSEKIMLRPLALAIALATVCSSALAADAGRYQIVVVPAPVEGPKESSALLLDTLTGRSWHLMVDDKGRPRWRGIEFAGGSQGIAAAPAEAQAPSGAAAPPEGGSATKP